MTYLLSDLLSYCFDQSFVRSVTMDKWKDIELAKMKVGGNKKAKEFLDSQPDWDWNLPLNERYNTLAAALYRDKVISVGRFHYY